MKQTLILLFALAFLIPTRGQGQVRETSSQNHGWYMFFGNHKLNDKWGLHTEYQWRRADWITTWQQSLARIGIDYKLKDNLTFTIGYAHIKTFPYGEFPVAHPFAEHRIWEQVITTHKIGRLALNHRYRLEQRNNQKIAVNTSGSAYVDSYVYTNRLRYRLMISIPLNKTAIEQGTLFASVYDEVFVGFGKNVQNNIFDQNRLYGAIGYQFTPRNSIQLGYLNQLVLRPSGTQLEINHTLQVALFINLDFSHKEETTP